MHLNAGTLFFAGGESISLLVKRNLTPSDWQSVWLVGKSDPEGSSHLESVGGGGGGGRDLQTGLLGKTFVHPFHIYRHNVLISEGHPTVAYPLQVGIRKKGP